MVKCLSELRFPVQYVEVFAAFLREQGQELTHYFSRCGLSDTALAAPGAMIDGTQLREILRVCREVASPERPLSAQLLEHFPVTAHGTLGIVIMTSPNLEAALEAALRFYPVVMPSYEIRREEMGDQVHLVFRPLCDMGDVADDLTETILGAFNSIRRYVSPSTRLLEIHLRHRARFDPDAYASFADPDSIHFGQPCNKIVIPKRHLRFSLITSNRATMEQFRGQLEQQIARLRGPGSYRGKVRERLDEALRGGRSLQVEDMAATLNMSSRTLGRRLQSEGVSFKQLANEARIDYAEFLLLNSSRPVSQVAYAAGFTNDSSFARAFRRRKGVTPTDMRRKAAGQDVTTDEP